MGYDYKHFEVNGPIKQVTDKSILVNVDGKDRRLPISRIRSVCLDTSGDLPIEKFVALVNKKGLPKGIMLSVEMDKWTNHYKIKLSEIEE